MYYILFLVILILSGCNKGVALGTDIIIHKDFNNVKVELLNEYKIEVDLNESEKLFKAKQWVTYVNNTPIDLKEIYFHIYPNAFNSLEKAPILFDQEFKDPLSYKPGYIEIGKVSLDNKNLNYGITGQDKTILKIELSKPLLKGEKTTIYFEYIVKLPNAKDRFGYGDRVINCGNWYPVACVYDKDGWNLDPYYKLGDPFYSDVSNYKVSITTNKDMIVATSGNILEEKISGNRKTIYAEGQLIRDFAWAASFDFKIKEKKADNTLVKLYYLDEHLTMADYSIDVGAKAIEIFNKVFGKYPYGQYSIVMTEFPSGMEYPGIVFINNEYYSRSAKIF